jgi:O-antigen ligase
MKTFCHAPWLPAVAWGVGLAVALPPLFRFAWDPIVSVLAICLIVCLLAVGAITGSISLNARRDTALLVFLGAGLISFSHAADAALARNELMVLAAGSGLFLLAANLTTVTVTRLTLIPLLAAVWHTLLLAATTGAAIGVLPDFRQTIAVLTVNPNILAGYLVLCLPLSCIWWHNKDGRFPTAGVLLTVMVLTGIVLTQSRAALLVTLLLGGVAWVRVKQRGVRLAVLIALTLGLFALVVSPKFVHAQSFYERLVWAETAFAQFRLHPLTGIGWGNYGTLFIAYRPELIQNTLYAHNLILQLLAETGIIGMAAFSLLVYSFFRAPREHVNPLRPALLLAIAAFLLINTVDYTFYIPAPQLLFWFCAGALFAADRLPQPSGLLPRMTVLAAAATVLAIAIPVGTGMLLVEQARAAACADRALEFLTAAVQHDPLPAGPYRKMAELYFQRYTATQDAQALRSAVEMQRQAVARNRADAAAWSDLAWLYVTSRSLPAARHAVLQAITHDRQAAAYRKTLYLIQPAQRASRP